MLVLSVHFIQHPPGFYTWATLRWRHFDTFSFGWLAIKPCKDSSERSSEQWVSCTTLTERGKELMEGNTRHASNEKVQPLNMMYWIFESPFSLNCSMFLKKLARASGAMVTLSNCTCVSLVPSNAPHHSLIFWVLSEWAIGPITIHTSYLDPVCELAINWL